MKNERVVIINGQAYDSMTGLPVAHAPQKIVSKVPKRFQDIRSVSKKVTHPHPAHTVQPSQRLASRPRTGGTMDISHSDKVSHFSRTTVNTDTKKTQPTDIAPVRHPLTVRVNGMRTAVARPLLKTMKQIKDEAITEAMERPRIEQPKRRKKVSRKAKILTICAACLIIFGLGGYLVYLYTPNLSVRLASAQAGIEAKYPEYTPDGYNVSGPISYRDSAVTINFKANAGNVGYKITQQKSSWDSSALKEQIDKDSKGEFATKAINGLTIYTYDGSAAWVNGGILYKILGDAHLLQSQIQKIATSL